MRSIILSLFYLSTLYLTRCEAGEPGQKIYGGNVTSDDVIEIQHAACRIVTEEIVANANATVTRVLTGSCNARMIDERFQNLEKNLTKELNEIKALLSAALERGSKPNEASLEATKSLNIAHRSLNNNNNNNNNNVSPRQEEINRFNGTVQEIPIGVDWARAFVYYWQVRDFDEKLASWKTGRSERSPTFYSGPGGYAMYIRVTPRYYPDGTVFVGIGLTRGRHDSVLEWPFSLRTRLEILDHSPEQFRQDRRSRIWDPTLLHSEYLWGRPKLTGEPDNPEGTGLAVSRQVLFGRLPSRADHRSRTTRYLWNGTVTIKLTVYL